MTSGSHLRVDVLHASRHVGPSVLHLASCSRSRGVRCRSGEHYPDQSSVAKTQASRRIGPARQTEEEGDQPPQVQARERPRVRQPVTIDLTELNIAGHQVPDLEVTRLKDATCQVPAFNSKSSNLGIKVAKVTTRQGKQVVADRASHQAGRITHPLCARDADGRDGRLG